MNNSVVYLDAIKLCAKVVGSQDSGTYGLLMSYCELENGVAFKKRKAEISKKSCKE